MSQYIKKRKKQEIEYRSQQLCNQNQAFRYFTKLLSSDQSIIYNSTIQYQSFVKHNWPQYIYNWRDNSYYTENNSISLKLFIFNVSISEKDMSLH